MYHTKLLTLILTPLLVFFSELSKLAYFMATYHRINASTTYADSYWISTTKKAVKGGSCVHCRGCPNNGAPGVAVPHVGGSESPKFPAALQGQCFLPARPYRLGVSASVLLIPLHGNAFSLGLARLTRPSGRVTQPYGSVSGSQLSEGRGEPIQYSKCRGPFHYWFRINLANTKNILVCSIFPNNKILKNYLKQWPLNIFIRMFFLTWMIS